MSHVIHHLKRSRWNHPFLSERDLNQIISKSEYFAYKVSDHGDSLIYLPNPELSEAERRRIEELLSQVLLVPPSGTKQHFSHSGILASREALRSDGYAQLWNLPDGKIVVAQVTDPVRNYIRERDMTLLIKNEGLFKASLSRLSLLNCLARKKGDL